MARRKLKIAVTGGIGAGKSEVCRLISEAGYKVINADDIAKDILKSDTAVRKKVIDLFGEESYLGDEVNRDYLSEKVFNDSENVAKINSIIHPLTLLRINKLISEEFIEKDIVFVEWNIFRPRGASARSEYDNVARIVVATAVYLFYL